MPLIDRLIKIKSKKKNMKSRVNTNPWDASERAENHVAERGLVPVSSGDVQVQQHDHGAAANTNGFVRQGQSCRYASSDIPSDLLVKVGGVNFHVHKYPMVSRSGRLARLVGEATAAHGADTVAVLELPDLPGGHGAFELAAKFCYGAVVDITAGNVAVLRCAAEYLEMTEEMEEGNLAFRAEAFLSYVVASSWRDSVVVLRSCDDGLSPWADDLQLVRRCCDSVAAKACTTSPRAAARWASYAGAGGRTSLSPKATPPRAGAGDGGSPPADWWVDDVCVLRIEHFVRVVTAVQARGMRPDLVGAAITRYAAKWLSSAAGGLVNNESPATSRGGGVLGLGLQMVIAAGGEGNDIDMNAAATAETASEQRRIVESLISIIPPQRNSVSCSFLLRLLRLAVALEAAPALVTEVEKLVGMQLDQAALADILVPSYAGGRSAAYDVDLVQRLVEQFLVQELPPPLQSAAAASGRGKEKPQQSSQQRVASLVDGYLAEVSRDRNLGVGKFQALAEALPETARACNDGLYRAMDAYLRAHPAATEHERRRLCRAALADGCGKLSREARLHAAQNERLPVRVAMQVLLAEQARMAAALARAGKRDDDAGALRAAVEGVSARCMELQREVELLQAQVERLLPASVAKQQNVSGWSSGWKKLGRLGRIQVEQPVVTAAAATAVTASREPRRRRNSVS